MQVKGAEKILYGLDDIADSKTAIIVEGECDKLALEEAGSPECRLGPEWGARPRSSRRPGPGGSQFSYLADLRR